MKARSLGHKAYRFSSKTDFRFFVSPTDQTDIGREILYRLLAAGCQWRLGGGAVIADEWYTANLHSPNANKLTTPYCTTHLHPNQ